MSKKFNKITALSTAAILAGSAITPVAALAAAPTVQDITDVIFTTESGQLASLDMANYEDALGVGAISVKPTHIIFDGSVYTMEDYEDALGVKGNVSDALQALKDSDSAIDVTVYPGEVTPDGKVVAEEGEETPATDLKVESVMATNNTTVTVKLAANYQGEVKAEDFTIAGLTVTSATLGTAGDTVILKTSAQEADKEYELTYKGEATGKKFVGKAAEGQAFDIKSAEAKSNTEVTVVLDDAPLRELTAADFQISNGLQVISVTTKDNVVNLKTTPQVAGAEYNVTTATGTGFASFVGLAAVDAAEVIQSINLENHRELKITFNKEVSRATAKDLSNYYLTLADETEGEIAKVENTLDNKATDLVVDFGNQELLKDKDGKTDLADDKQPVSYVIIKTKGEGTDTAKTLAKVFDWENKQSITISTRGLKDVKGAYTHNSSASFVYADNQAPSLSKVPASVAVEELIQKGYNNSSKLFVGEYKIEKDRAYLPVTFSEPIVDFDQSDLQIFIDGIPVSMDATQTKVPFIVELGTADDGEYIAQDGTVEANRTLLIDVTALERTTDHVIKIVGAKDLEGHVLSPNAIEATFKVLDKKRPEQVKYDRPNVKKITQISDSFIRVDFDQKVAFVDGAETVATIKGADYIGPKEEALDLDIKVDDFTANKHKVENNADGTTSWIIDINAAWTNEKDKGGNDQQNDGSVTDFLEQNEIIRTVEVKNFRLDASTDEYFYGDTTREALTLTVDQDAPKVETVEVTGDKEITVTFSDAPFNGDIGLGLEGKEIKVSRTEGENSNNETQVFTLEDDNGSTTAEGLSVDNNKLTITVDEPTLLKDGKLFADSVYTVTFDEDSIMDVAEDIIGTGDGINIVTNANGDSVYHGIKASAHSVKTPKAGEQVTEEGRVPQTSKGLIQSGADVLKAAGTNPVDASHSTLTNVDTFAQNMAKNPNQIVVVLDGEVSGASASNKGNYRVNGKSLSKDSKITFVEGKEINPNTGTTEVGGSGDGTADNYVIIELAAGDVAKSGLYTFEASGITNKSGKKMLPVKTSVQLVDNTAPTVQSVKVLGSKQVELTFDELVAGTLTDGAIDVEQAKKNFKVTVNGQVLAVNHVKFGTTKNKVVLELSQDFATKDAKVSVQVVENAGKLYIKDEAGNDLALGTKTN